MPYENMFSKSTQSHDVRTHLEPQVISHPAATAEEEQLPLVPTHAHVGNGAVDDFSLACFGKLSLFFTFKADQTNRRSRTYDHRRFADRQRPCLRQLMLVAVPESVRQRYQP
jgi:hypothetical protein